MSVFSINTLNTSSSMLDGLISSLLIDEHAGLRKKTKGTLARKIVIATKGKCLKNLRGAV